MSGHEEYQCESTIEHKVGQGGEREKIFLKYIN